MSRFNETAIETNLTTNYEGAKAYSLSSELELYSLACTCLFNDKFYENSDKQRERLIKLIKEVSPEFAAKLAVYVREKMYLRSLPVVLTVELAKVHHGDNLITRTVNRIVQRADEITEILAYYQKTNQRKSTKKLNKLSKQIQKGLASAFNKFDEYAFGKYNRDTEVKFRDALFLVHPKAKNTEQQELFNKIINRNLEIPYTWEVELSALGQQKFETKEAKDKAIKEKWEELVSSKKLGYMALLRNLRNLLDAGVSEATIDSICAYLSSPTAVKKSKQLPFRFFSAYMMLQENKSLHTDKILKALEEAVKYSIENIPGVDGKVLIVCDVSGSMQATISPKSVVQRYDIGVLLGQLLKIKTPTSLFGIFGDYFKIKRFSSSQPLQNTLNLHNIEGEVGYSTNGYLAIDWLIKNETKVDKVMIFTDCQMWDSVYGNTQNFADYWNRYKRISPNAELYLFDMAGYGNTPVSTRNNSVFLISGWSDRVFEVIEALRNGESAIDEIKKIEI